MSSSRKEPLPFSQFEKSEKSTQQQQQPSLPADFQHAPGCSFPHLHYCQPEYDAVFNEAFELRAEVERLREALRDLVAWSDQNEPIHEAMRNAKAALNEQ